MLFPKFYSSIILALLVLLSGCGNDSQEDSGFCSDSSARSGYPAGPYGLSEGDTLANLSFKDSGGNDFELGSLYEDGDARLLLISTGAGWCSACIEEQPLLEQWSTEYKDKGLRVVMTVFEDSSSQAADVAYANTWKNEYNLSIPVLADTDAQFGAYYNSDLAPMNMIVEACTMKIMRIIVGADSSAIETIIEAKL